jgi:hypothetical protein
MRVEQDDPQLLETNQDPDCCDFVCTTCKNINCVMGMWLDNADWKYIRVRG